MASHHDNHHTEEKKPVSFRTPLILGLVTLLAIVLLVSTCDKKHGHCECKEECSEECMSKCESGDHSGHNSHAVEATTAEQAEEVATTEETSVGSLDSLGNFIYHVGDMQTIDINGTALSVGANSTEAKLFAFLSNKEAHVDTVDKTKGWISLDRVYFENGKSVLTKESEQQLKNIALILKAYPTAMVKIGGYTDNTGSEATNVKVSGERAAVALKALTNHGVIAANLKSEGYGPMHPIASNDTPEGRAQNRRVDIRITKK